MTVTISCAHLTKRYGDRLAVDDVTFEAHEGEVVGLLGPNGAGKTTTVRLLTTVLAPTSGTFEVAGKTEPVEIRRRVGVLPESAGYPGGVTGLEYLVWFARLFGLSRTGAAATAEDLLTTVGLADRAGSLVSSYSRGMRQRLGLARALVNEPRVVFLDEPTLGLDPAGQREVLALVRDVAARRGTTVLLSSHDLPDVEAVCSTVVVLHRGRLLTSGRLDEVAHGGSLADAFLELTAS